MAFPTGWGRYCAVTIDNAYVGSTLTDFPVLCDINNLPSEMFDADGSYPALNGGGDIRFSSDSAGATQLPCEVVSFVTNNNPALGSAQIYVKVPTVSSSADTTIYVWYNKAGESQPAASDTYGSENVWDSNYAAVYHMEQDPSGSAPQVLDSTANDRHGTSAGSMTSGDLVTGKVGNGLDFDGSNDYIQCPVPISSSATTQTMEFTNNRTSGGRIDIGTGDADTRRFAIAADNTTTYLVVENGSTNYPNAASASHSVYHHHCVVFDGGLSSTSRVKWYLDGSSQSLTPGGSGNPASLYGGTSYYFIGRNGNDGFGPYDYASGIIDEFRVSSIARSADWISATYTNLFTPGTFATAGTPASPGGGTDTTELFGKPFGLRGDRQMRQLLSY